MKKKYNSSSSSINGTGTGWFKQVAPFFFRDENAGRNVYYNILMLIVSHVWYHADPNELRKRVTVSSENIYI